MGVFRPGLETPVYDLHVLIKELIDAIGGVSGGIASMLTELENVNSNLNQLMDGGSATIASVGAQLDEVLTKLNSVEGAVLLIETNTDSLQQGSLPLPVDQV